MTNQSSNPQSQELLACPVCFKEATKQTDLMLPAGGTYRQVVFCNNYSCWMFGIKVELDKWNTRHTPTLPLPDDLSKAIEEIGNWRMPSKDLIGNPIPFDSVHKCYEAAKLVKSLKNELVGLKLIHTMLREEAESQLAAAAKQSRELREQLMTVHVEHEKERNGNWMDKHGACKVCSGEIPDGHTTNCDIYKLEQQSREQRELIDRLDSFVQLVHKHFQPDLTEPGRTIFWRAVDLKSALAHAQGFGKDK